MSIGPGVRGGSRRWVAAALAAGALGAAPAGRREVLRPLWHPSENYGETYTFVADLDGGGYVQLSLGITNLGPGTSHGLCRAVVVLPDKHPWVEDERVPSEDWNYRAGAERLEVGPCAATGGAGTAVEARLAGSVLRLDFEGPLRPTRPPGAVVTDGEDRFTSEVLLWRVPVAAVLSFPGAPPIVAKGGGYADHSRGSIPTRSLARAWVRFRGLRGERGLLVLGRESPRGAFAPVWSTEDLSTFAEYPGFRLRRSGPDGRPSFRVELPAASPSLEIESGELLYRDAPVEGLGILGALLKPFVGNPVTWVYRACARTAGRTVPGILEVEVME